MLAIGGEAAAPEGASEALAPAEDARIHKAKEVIEFLKTHTSVKDLLGPERFRTKEGIAEYLQELQQTLPKLPDVECPLSPT